MKVAICDDEQKTCAELEDMLLKVFNKLNIKADIDVFLKGKELCQKIEVGEAYDLIFLDINLGENEKNGISIGKAIRDICQNNSVSIIYISWEKGHAFKLFGSRPLNFLLKPLKYDEVAKEINVYFTVIKTRSREFHYKTRQGASKVHIKDIIYIESLGRKLKIHLATGETREFYGSLSKVYVEQLTNSDFLFIHASYLVNYDYIASISSEKLRLADCEITIPISRINKSKAMMEYYLITEKRKEQ